MPESRSVPGPVVSSTCAMDRRQNVTAKLKKGQRNCFKYLDRNSVIWMKSEFERDSTAHCAGVSNEHHRSLQSFNQAEVIIHEISDVE